MLPNMEIFFENCMQLHDYDSLEFSAIWHFINCTLCIGGIVNNLTRSTIPVILKLDQDQSGAYA